MNAPLPTRAEEAREAGQVAYEAWVEGEGFNLVAVSSLPLTPWRSLSDEAKAIWEAIERKSAARAEAEVARLTERVEKAERERDEARADQKAAEDSNDAIDAKLNALTPHGSCACSYDRPGDVCLHHSPALADAEARVAVLEGALKPFSDYAEHMSDWGKGEIGEYFHGGIRRSIRTQDLRAARAALHGGENAK